MPGNEAYTVQDDALDRMYMALAAESPDRSVRASVVGNGEQFNTSFSGGFFKEIGGFTPPAPDTIYNRV